MPPPAPATPVASLVITGTSFALSWAAIPGASGYIINRDGAFLMTTGSTGLTETRPIDTYTYYTVQAYTTDGSGTSQSAASNTVGGWSDRSPLAPTLTSPAGNPTLDRTVTQRFSFVHSDPDSGDTQSKYDLRYRIGAGAWTTVTGVTPNGFHDFAGGTFSADAFEWQARTYDQSNAVGPWSASEFFTAATPPAGPTITAPVNGSVIAEGTVELDWSYPTQDAYEVRKVADASGSPDTGAVYYDSLVVEDTVTRSVVLALPVNARYEHLQVRVRDGGLWSTYSSVRVQVAFTPPATPTLTVLASDAEGAIGVLPAHPTPVGDEPDVVSVNILRRETAAGGGGIRIAKDRSPTGLFLDHAVASGVDYEYAAVAVGANGGTAQSAWTGGSPTTDPLTIYGDGY